MGEPQVVERRVAPFGEFLGLRATIAPSQVNERFTACVTMAGTISASRASRSSRSAHTCAYASSSAGQGWWVTRVE